MFQVSQLDQPREGILMNRAQGNFGSKFREATETLWLYQSPNEKPMDNVKIVAAAWEAFASRDAVRIAACFAPDAEWIAPRGNATAIALDCPDHMRGAEAIARFIAVEFGRLFVADVRIDFRTMVAAGELVLVEERMRATLVSGGSYDLSYCFVFAVVDSRIVQVREYMDTRSGWKQIFGDEPGRKLVA